MGLQLTKTTVSNGIPIWQGKGTLTAQGGFTLDTNGLTKGNTLPAGTVMTFDETTRKAKPAAATGDPLVSDAKGLLYQDIEIQDYSDVTVVIAGVVYQNRIPDMSANEAAHKKALPRITFSQSY